MLPYSRLFDQHTLALLIDHDAIVQRYRALFALLECQALPDQEPDPSRPGKRPHHSLLPTPLLVAGLSSD